MNVAVASKEMPHQHLALVRKRKFMEKKKKPRS